MEHLHSALKFVFLDIKVFLSNCNVCASVWQCFYSLTVQQTILRVLRWLMRGLPDDGTCDVLKHVRNLPTSDEHIFCM